MYRININTKKLILYLFKNGILIKKYHIAVGKPSTPTPLGHWLIIKKGLWGAQFGGHFMQLNVPWGTMVSMVLIYHRQLHIRLAMAVFECITMMQRNFIALSQLELPLIYINRLVRICKAFTLQPKID